MDGRREITHWKCVHVHVHALVRVHDVQYTVRDKYTVNSTLLPDSAELC